MTDLRAYIVFAETVAAGSMSAAARRLGLSPSAVSQVIGGLERQTGVRLFHRSTRKLVLTEAGERCYPHCLRLIAAGDAATASLEQSRDAPSGELRIAAPVGFGAHIAPALAPVLAEWPDMRLRLLVDDELIDLIGARADIAVRVGSLPDSHWVALKLADLDSVLCASSAYLEANGMPAAPADLLHHRWLALRRNLEPSSVVSAHGDVSPTLDVSMRKGRSDPQHLSLPIRASTNNQIALQHLCEQGMGIAVLFLADVRSALDRGALMRVLPDWALPTYPVSLLTPDREGMPAKVKVAVAALRRYFATL